MLNLVPKNNLKNIVAIEHSMMGEHYVHKNKKCHVKSDETNKEIKKK